MTSLTPPTPRSYRLPVEFVLLPGGASARRREVLLALMRRFADDVEDVPVELDRAYSGRSEVFEIRAKGYGEEEDARREISKRLDLYIDLMTEGAEDGEEWSLDFVY